MSWNSTLDRGGVVVGNKVEITIDAEGSCKKDDQLLRIEMKLLQSKLLSRLRLTETGSSSPNNGPLGFPKKVEISKSKPNRLSRFASHPERPLRALGEQGFERHRLWDQSLLVHVAHERLERAPIALKPVWPEVLAHQVHGLVGVLDQER